MQQFNTAAEHPNITCRPIPIALLCALFFSQSNFAQSSDIFTTQELIFPLQEKHVHGSSIVSLPNGDILAAWFEGSGERKADDVQIRGSRWQKSTQRWSPPFDMADTPNLPDCNPVLFLNHQNKLHLTWIAVQANKWENSIIKYKTSTDYSMAGPPVWEWQENILLKPDDTFAEEVAKKMKDLPQHEIGWAAYAPAYDEMIVEASKNPTCRSFGWMTRIPPLLLPVDTILLPLYSDGLNMSLIAISTNDGQSWKPSKPIVGRGPIQPSLVLKKNGDVLAYMRDAGDAPARVQLSTSQDRGLTWSPALKSDIPNTASVSVIQLFDGRWAFVGNMINDGRYQLALWISEDEGISWTHKIFLENDQNKNAGYSYPCIIQSRDGLLHVSYSYQLNNQEKSIKYVEIDPARIK